MEERGVLPQFVTTQCRQVLKLTTLRAKSQQCTMGMLHIPAKRSIIASLDLSGNLPPTLNQPKTRHRRRGDGGR